MPRPLEDLLPPEHAQVVVDAALAHQLHLGGVPQRIVRACVLELLERVHVGARVGGVRLERLARPGRQRLVAIVVGGVVAHVEADLAPGDELVEEALGRR